MITLLMINDSYKHSLIRFFCLLLLLIFSGTVIFAEIRLPALIGDNMVLQQKSEVNFWGKAKPNSEVHIKVSWDNSTYTTLSDAKGNWEVEVNTIAGSETPYEISINDGNELILRNVLLGEVWLCGGQSNMEMSARGYANQPLYNAIDEVLDSDYPSIRFFPIRRSSNLYPLDDVSGNWRLSSPENVETFSIVGYNFAKLLNKVLQVPVGLIGCYWGGSKIEAWISKEKLSMIMPVSIEPNGLNSRAVNETPTLLYNGMLHPVSRYTIKGCIFYQGEANVTDPQSYLRLFPAMVQNWRKSFGYNFPFYYVQLAPFGYSNMGWNSIGIEAAKFREAQADAHRSIPTSGIVSTLDIGSESTIHPPEKRTVAKRLGYLALSKTYDVKGFEAEAPEYMSYRVDGNLIIVKMKNVGYGLSAYGREYEGFEIAGEDRVFHKAKVEKLKGAKDELIIYSERVPTPIAARYGFKNYTYGNLYNSYGIAALPFRTDDW